MVPGRAEKAASGVAGRFLPAVTKVAPSDQARQEQRQSPEGHMMQGRAEGADSANAGQMPAQTHLRGPGCDVGAAAGEDEAEAYKNLLARGLYAHL